MDGAKIIGLSNGQTAAQKIKSSDFCCFFSSAYSVSYPTKQELGISPKTIHTYVKGLAMLELSEFRNLLTKKSFEKKYSNRNC